MDANRNANLINSVAAGEFTVCPSCAANNKAGSRTCSSCGAKLGNPVADTEPSAFDAVSGVEQKTSDYVEPSKVFAQGLPAWDVVPPQVMIRRR